MPSRENDPSGRKLRTPQQAYETAAVPVPDSPPPESPESASNSRVSSSLGPSNPPIDAGLQHFKALTRARRPLIEAAAEVLLIQFGLAPDSVIGLEPEARKRLYFRVVSRLTLELFLARLKQAAIDVGVGSARLQLQLTWEIDRLIGRDAIPIRNLLEEKSAMETPGQLPDATADQFFEKLCSLANIPTEAKVERPPTTTPVEFMLEDDRILKKEGKRYFPLPMAASLGQVPKSTLANWINTKMEFQGRPLKSYYSETAKRMYLEDESVQRVANRFVKWPSQEPAGSVLIGETTDGSGYIGITKAAKIIGVDHHTVWLWIKRENAPTQYPPDVIKCQASEQFYMLEKEAVELKKLIPKSGLRVGRRPRATIQPA